MLNNLRNRLPDIEKTRGLAVDRVLKTANNAAQSAKDVSVQLEEWAKDGFESAKKRPLMWGAASLGFGALLGGLWALWRQSTKPQLRTAPLRSRAKAALRAATKTNGAAGKKAGKARRNGASASA